MSLSERAIWALHNYGTTAVFVATAVESVLVPIPTPPFVMGAGAFLIPQELSWRQALLPMLLKVALPGAAGTALGSLVIFGLCFWGGRRAIERYGRFFGLSWDSVQKINARLSGQVEVAVLATRAIPMFPISVISAAAGVLRMNAVSFTWWTFAGSVLRYMMLGYAGFLTRNSYDLAQGHVSHAQRGLALGIGLTLAAVGMYLWKRRKAA